MLMSGRLRRLLLAGTCLCVCGTPVHLPSGSRGASGPAGGRRLLETWVGTASHRFQASSPEPPQLSSTAGEARDQREGGRAERDPETSPPSTPESPHPGTSSQRDASPSCGPPSASPRTSTRLSIWGRDEATSPLPDPVLPEIGPNLMPREDGPDSLWTEASRPSGGDTAAPPSQDEATEGTMSSEALPLIFEPFEDVTSEGAGAAAPGGARPPGAAGTPRPEAGGPSDAPSLLMPDWTSPWQTSGGELLEPSAPPGPSASGAEGHSERGAARTPDASPSLSSFQPATTTVTVATRRPAHKPRSGLEEMESEEEDEDEENSEDSVEEDDSEEDQTETPRVPSTRPPYGLVPPPPVWFQRNQGLMRSWVELIREKAGYVSGMLVPVGIGITGALLIVGALYSVRVIHRKRRNSFKHQRRKVRQQEQPREPGTGPQDQAMLLADSSEDEF
ncbi:armh4 [Pungitius sinensis]